MDTPAATIVLPGDALDPSAFLPPRDQLHQSRSKKQPPPLRLGSGIRQLLPAGDFVPTVAGQVMADRKKNLLWVEGQGGRYAPVTGDYVVGQVVHASTDQAIVALAPHDAPPLRAVLPALAFAGATRKNRPDLHAGSLVYARVALAGKHMDTELECVDQTTGKADGLGPLVGGMVFNISTGLARRLLMPSNNDIAVLESLDQEGLAFETAVGQNGRLWVQSEDRKTVVLVGRAIQATDAQHLDARAQKALVRKLVRGGS